MCIAVYKPAGVKVPSKKTLQTCFENNPNGAGFMFPINGKVHVEKGFMTFNAFKTGLKNALKKYHIKDGGESMPMVFHFRITSHGNTCPELTHPFALSNDYATMRQLVGDYDFACAHNGIIDLTAHYNMTDRSDTMEFIKEILYPLVDGKKTYYKNKNFMGVIDYILEGNRFAIMDGSGHVELLGDWNEEKGVFYSNFSYTYKKSSYKITKPYGYYGYDYGYDDYDYNETEDNDDLKYGVYKQLSDAQISTLYLYERLVCRCGCDMILDYDSTIDAYIAYCEECGEFYILDDEDASFAIAHDVGYNDPYDDKKLDGEKENAQH